MRPKKTEEIDGSVYAVTSVEGWMATVFLFEGEVRQRVLTATDLATLSEDGQEVRVRLDLDLWEAIDRTWQEIADGVVS